MYKTSGDTKSICTELCSEASPVQHLINLLPAYIFCHDVCGVVDWPGASVVLCIPWTLSMQHQFPHWFFFAENSLLTSSFKFGQRKF